MRFLLLKDHYLKACPPDLDEVEWEYRETDRVTGREKRRRYSIPFYCEEGKVVCWKGQGQPDDIVFDGAPTPMMRPLDAEAEAEWEKESKRWKTMDFIGSLEDSNYEAQLLDMMQKKADAAFTSISNVANVANVASAQSGVSREEFDALREQLAAVMAKNAELESKPRTPNLRR